MSPIESISSVEKEEEEQAMRVEVPPPPPPMQAPPPPPPEPPPARIETDRAAAAAIESTPVESESERLSEYLHVERIAEDEEHERIRQESIKDQESRNERRYDRIEEERDRVDRLQKLWDAQDEEQAYDDKIDRERDQARMDQNERVAEAARQQAEADQLAIENRAQQPEPQAEAPATDSTTRNLESIWDDGIEEEQETEPVAKAELPETPRAESVPDSPVEKAEKAGPPETPRAEAVPDSRAEKTEKAEPPETPRAEAVPDSPVEKAEKTEEKKPLEKAEPPKTPRAEAVPDSRAEKAEKAESPKTLRAESVPDSRAEKAEKAEPPTTPRAEAVPDSRPEKAEKAERRPKAEEKVLKDLYGAKAGTPEHGDLEKQYNEMRRARLKQSPEQYVYQRDVRHEFAFEEKHDAEGRRTSVIARNAVDPNRADGGRYPLRDPATVINWRTTEVGEKADRKVRGMSKGTGYDAGHLVGLEFGADPNERRNVSNQNAMQNEGLGTYYDFEKRAASNARGGHKVGLEIEAKFTPEGQEKGRKVTTFERDDSGHAKPHTVASTDFLNTPSELTRKVEEGKAEKGDSQKLRGQEWEDARRRREAQEQYAHLSPEERRELMEKWNRLDKDR